MIAVTIIAYSLLTACLALFFQFCIEPGEVFGRYGLFLQAVYRKNWRQEDRWVRYWLKPLGYCRYCNGTWLAIIVYFVVVIPEGSEIHGFRPAITAIIGLFLFIGVNYIWIRLLSRITV